VVASAGLTVLSASWPTVGVEVSRIDRCGDISDEDAKNPSRVAQHNIGVHLQVCFAAVANKDEFALREVSH
jgi:hypothetical protein